MARLHRGIFADATLMLRIPLVRGRFGVSPKTGSRRFPCQETAAVCVGVHGSTAAAPVPTRC